MVESPLLSILKDASRVIRSMSLGFLIFLLVTCTSQTRTGETHMLPLSTMRLTSPAFESNGPIPSRYTCDGEGERPPLLIGDVPPLAKSLALYVLDPDAPMGTFVHWVAWNIPPQTTQIEATASFPGTEGRNGAGKTGYFGPCPPSGTHHYHFTLFALDTMLDLPPTTGKAELLAAIEGHERARAELTGLYQRVR